MASSPRIKRSKGSKLRPKRRKKIVTITICEQEDGKFNWHGQGKNGEIRSDSGEGYTRERDAFRAAEGYHFESDFAIKVKALLKKKAGKKPDRKLPGRLAA